MDTIINLDEKLVHKRGYRDYLITTKEGWEKVSGKPIKINGMESFDMFVCGSKANGDISISEKTSGRWVNTPGSYTIAKAKFDIEEKLAESNLSIKAVKKRAKSLPKAPYHLMNK